jgi:hypothetical protein
VHLAVESAEGSGRLLMGSRGVSERLGRKVKDLPNKELGDELELRKMGMGRSGMLSC